jgi:hypothetical protein
MNNKHRDVGLLCLFLLVVAIFDVGYAKDIIIFVCGLIVVIWALNIIFDIGGKLKEKFDKWNKNPPKKDFESI